MPELLTEAPPASTENLAQAMPNTTTQAQTTAANPDDLGIDRAFVMSMARIPFIAIGWAALSVIGWKILASLAPTVNPVIVPVAIIAFGMVLAAVIDGWAFKVPNWLTLSLVMSGWYLGLLHDFGLAADGVGGIGSALLGTLLGWGMLFPILFVGGMGQGDVKMTMGFGSWIGATFGFLQNSGEGAMIILCAFALGVVIGGIFGLIMMALRRQFHKNLQNTREIFTDLQVMLTAGPKQAAERANSRRKDWVRLPYGVPLCVGFLGFLAYKFNFFM